MRVVFAGPSLHGVPVAWGDVVCRGPAEAGAVEQALADGASVIGLVDGHYGEVGAVWHKEILYALAAGATIFGAASMGALRAAECEPFGMVPIGSIARRYCRGALFDDADVAITNGPAELGYPPLTEALVDVVATTARLAARHLVTPAEAAAIEAAARALFFADRTVDALFASLGAPHLKPLYRAHRVSQKTRDALALVAAVRAHRRSAPHAAPAWRLAASPFWTKRDRRRSSSVTPR